MNNTGCHRQIKGAYLCASVTSATNIDYFPLTILIHKPMVKNEKKKYDSKSLKLTQIKYRRLTNTSEETPREKKIQKKIMRSGFSSKNGPSRYFQIDPKRFRMAIDQKSEHLKTDHAAMFTKISAICPAKNIFKN
jgi:hypothetical protein